MVVSVGFELIAIVLDRLAARYEKEVQGQHHDDEQVCIGRTSGRYFAIRMRYIPIDFTLHDADRRLQSPSLYTVRVVQDPAHNISSTATPSSTSSKP